MHFFRAIQSLQHQAVARLILIAGFVTGTACFAYYYANGLTTAHYDAKAHLLVARRIVDAIAPGYEQMGLNWLPLIHLVYLPFVLFDGQYHTGFLPSLVSVCAFAFSGYLAYTISYRLTHSIASGVFAGIVLLANPNLQYLQSCPMTEPLYMVLLLMAAERLIAWRDSGCHGLPWLAAIWASLGCLCRYEGWGVLGGVLLLLAYDYWKKTFPRRTLLRAGGVFIAALGIPAIAHFGYIFLRLGNTFFGTLAGGYHTPYVTFRRPFLSIFYHSSELAQVSTSLLLIMAAAGLFLLFVQRADFNRRLPLLVLWIPSLINIAALNWGLIYRVRYSVLLIPAVAIFGSLVLASEKASKRALLLMALVPSFMLWLTWGVHLINPEHAPLPGPGALVLPVAGLILFLTAHAWQWHRGALILLCALGVQIPPLARENRAMMVETMEHEFIEPERKSVLQYLSRNYDGTRILIDMGTEAPLVYDTRLAVKEFVYNEGGDSLWHAAARNPETVTGWLCAQDGDAVSRFIEKDPSWAANYSIVVKTERYRLYRLIRDSRLKIETQLWPR